MARFTLEFVRQKADLINATLPDGYYLKVSRRDGYTTIDLYNESGMLSNFMCATCKECGLALDLAYKLRMNFKMN